MKPRALLVGLFRASALAAVASLPSPARADGLHDVALRIEEAWKAAGGTVARRETRFVMEDEPVTIDLRPDPAHLQDECRRIALIGARGLSFHVVAAVDADDDSFQIASTAGVVELQGCGGVPDRVKLKSDSGRGALETVIASAPRSLPPAFGILLERTGGVLPSSPEPGPLPPLPPPGARASLFEERMAREGLSVRPQLTWMAGDDGKGGAELTLDEGCHHIGLFGVEPRIRDRGLAPASGRHAHLDLDGALHREGGELLAEDQSIAPDVRLDACVAIATKVNATFEGAPRDSPVVVTHAFSPLPGHLPRAWGPAMRARFASALAAHYVAPPPEDPVLLAQGASGPTPIPVDLEPGACYVAVAALERGRGRGHALTLHATIGERSSEDEHGAKEDAAIVAFCAEDARHGRLEVETRTSGSAWGVIVFRMEGGVWSASP